MKLYEDTAIAYRDKEKNKKPFIVCRPGQRNETVGRGKTYIINEECTVKSIEKSDSGIKYTVKLNR